MILSPNDRCLKVYRRQGLYPSAWKKGRIQEILLNWAGRKCENCGATEQDALLHVHHIHWNDKQDCRFENLVVLCVSCHTKVHNHKWQPGKPWTLTSPTPEWITIRGYDNPAPVEVPIAEDPEKQELLMNAIEASEKHVRLAIALQKEGIKLMQSLQSYVGDPERMAKIMKEATSCVSRGAKMEADARKSLLQLKK